MKTILTILCISFIRIQGESKPPPFTLQTINKSAGIFYEPFNIVLLETSSWKLINSIDLANYYDIYDNFVFSYKKLTELCDFKDSQKEYLKPCAISKNLLNNRNRIFTRVQDNHNVLGEVLNNQQF